MLRIVARSEIDSLAWDACVAASSQQILYGYAWYLDIVLPSPSWKWMGAVLTDEANLYQAVMPIPLRRKHIFGVTYSWVVHQPFFCQFLGFFSRDKTLDSTPFFRIMEQTFRYCSTISIRQEPDKLFTASTIRTTSTHILDLSAGYETIYKNYTRDRKENLKRARHQFDTDAGWTSMESTDVEPLLTLFRENHADSIDGGVADWAYSIFGNLAKELIRRDLVTLRFALHDGHIVAGVLFVSEGNRIIYLFNAASETGRRTNARTWLIDQMIRESAGRLHAGEALIFDFESPDKPSIRTFYQSFGAVGEPFWEMRWNQLSPVENIVRTLKNALKLRSKIL